MAEAAIEAIDDVVRESLIPGIETLTTIKKPGGDIIKTLETAGGQTVTTIRKSGGDIVNSFVKAGEDATASYTKGWRDASEQAKRSFQDTVDAGAAGVNYTYNQIKSIQSVAINADKRLREGKVIDSMWGLAIEPLQASEANFAIATQESSLIATAASSAAAAYGGPGGAAAYAAWATYRATGNADQALRAGLLAAATTQAGGAVATMPSGTMGEVVRKAAMAGAAGGIAVAAAGGDEQSIKDGFLKSAGAVLVQAGTDQAKAYDPKVKDAWDTVQCISAKDVDCVSKTTWVKDIKGRITTDAQGLPIVESIKLDPQKYLGKWTSFDPNSPEAKKLALLSQLSEIPKVSAIPLMKNRWILTWMAGKNSDIKLGEPVAVLTYIGTDAPFRSSVRYGESDPTEAWISDIQAPSNQASGNFDCILAGIKRKVRTTVQGTGCEAIYRRDDGKQQILWQSKHNPHICAAKAIEFVKQKKVPGMQCNAL